MYSTELSDFLDRSSVLLVDDNAALRGLLKTVLSAMGCHSVHEAADVRAAMEIIQSDPLDLMICDWKMRPVDGLALVRWVRNHNKCANPDLPILMLTCYSEAWRVKEARDAGVNEFMVKPFSPESIYQHIRAIVQQPRDFVQARDFYGPDRRRTNNRHDGPDRRCAVSETISGERSPTHGQTRQVG